MTEKEPNHFNLGVAETRKVRHVSTYLTMKQKREVLNELGERPYILLDHYFYKVNVHSFDFSDEKVAKELGQSERTIRRWRTALIRTDWILQFTYTCHKIIPTKVTVVGKELVQKYRTDSEEFSEYLTKVFEATKGM